MFIDPIFSLGSQCLIATQVANSFGLVCIVTNAVPGWVDKTIKTPSFQRVDMTDIGIDMNRYDKDIAIQCNSMQFNTIHTIPVSSVSSVSLKKT